MIGCIRTITRNGQAVEVYGKWDWDSNAHCGCDDERWDGVWAEGADDWHTAVEVVTSVAKSMGTTLIEMSAV